MMNYIVLNHKLSVFILQYNWNYYREQKKDDSDINIV